ncbi:hypothetical protein TI39_contig623g00016 [Zymoseptoria brevis]|uniref:non-specific serine/threonine protein kinase n=1 Tax=Zymoseptoria brevis TaxID=1047168 RepID=A0A0F4GGG4_9PEZI|nr:hypothetical protein TI39_contig623g00016 [Zymoseptoria brevis]
MAGSQQSGSTGLRKLARIKALGKSQAANAEAPKCNLAELNVAAEENEDEDGNDGDQNSGGEPARKKAKDKEDSPQGRSDRSAPKSQGRPNEGGGSTGRRGTPDQVEAGASGLANEGGEENAGNDETEKEPTKISATNLKLNLDYIRSIVLSGHVDEVPVGLEKQMECVSAMNEQDMRKAMKILQELIGGYGTRTLLWSLRVWPIEAYMNVPIHFDGRWDVFEDDAIVTFRDNWRDTCIEAQRKNATRREVEGFVDGYRKAKFLLKLGVEVDVGKTSVILLTEVEQAAFEGIHAEAREYIQRYDEFIYPPDGQDPSCHLFVWRMWDKMDPLRKEWIEKTRALWSNALDSASGEESKSLYLLYTQASRHMELGGWPMSEECVKNQKMIVRHEWRDLEAAVPANEVDSAAYVHELGNEAKRLLENFVFIAPPGKDNTMSWATFIDETLRPLFGTGESLAYWTKLWHTTIVRQRVLDEADARLLEGLKQVMDEEQSQPNPPKPYGPNMARYYRDWDIVMKRATEEVTKSRKNGLCVRTEEVTVGRANDLYVRTVECRKTCGVLISPIDWPRDVNFEQYCADLSAYISERVRAIWQQHWREWKTLREISDEQYTNQYNAMVDAVKRGQEYWPPETPAPEIYRGKEQAEALGVRKSDRSGLEGSWNFNGTLGSGAYGHVGYWTKKDGNTRHIVDRIAVKESYLSRTWNFPTHWIGEADYHKPREFFYARELASMPESRNVVKPRSEIPIRMIWSVFESLASVLCLMKSGTLPDASRAEQPTYPGMIHEDLKPDNIFLSTPSGDIWDGLPTFKIGDFGFVRSNVDDLATMDRTGTAVFLPPDPHPSSAGDVWRTGKIMLDLMNRQTWHRERDETYDLKLRELDNYVGNRFPPSLRTLVRECLSMQPNQRPTCRVVDMKRH